MRRIRDLMMQDRGKERRVRVLIADDQRPTRQGLKALLALWPRVEVVGEAADGQESVALVAESHPDVVLMDMRMPVMDGLEATRRIKSQWPEIRVVALSMDPVYQPKARAAGADVFLLKGCRAEELEAALVATV
jgi:DNA-binding NarL/FixJ family response regulator